MKASKCYLCDVILTKDNKSAEHILLNAIGGRLKSKNLLCGKCNSEIGHDCDSELAQQLLFLSNFLAIKRNSGKNPAIKGIKTGDGKFYDLIDGKPVASRPTITKELIEGNKMNISASAGNIKQMLSLLKGLKRKNPQLDLDEIKKQFRNKSEYLNEPLTFQATIGGDTAFRSICKTAINYYIYSQKAPEQVKHLFNYLKGLENLKIANHYYPVHTKSVPIQDEISHLLYLVGEKNSKLLYCFVEFFSSYSFIVLLSDNYSGNDFSSSYCYDVLQNSIVDKNPDFRVSKWRFRTN